MYDPISDSTTRASWAGEPSRSPDSSNFTETLADLVLRKNLPTGEFPEKMGCCVSTPRAWDPGEPSTTSPARESTSVFQYRETELHDANVDGICVGLAAEWLGNVHNSPRSRMNALAPGSHGYYSAANLQERYMDIGSSRRTEGAETSQAALEARTTVLQSVGLEPSRKEKVYAFDDPESFSSMLKRINKEGSKHLLSLRFAEGGRHVVATAVSGGKTTLFDPNYGEFVAEAHQMGSLFQSLANRYRNPNGLHLSTVSVQKTD
ncbi:putative cysteine protease YopT-like protein [Mesorhizobium amorphae]|uniref:YopT-type cysteine protease domain-containing protein n=1 Tax=Mesorhizobium amorphae TaxID=71433 RepID=UPI00235BD297|nr:YopT-type cysteine protease domain-containing protein [Mesorhizobium amorphae]GLR46245.1 putative cysteine protease YopT-like protein [Mesorhizobium amorphae]